METIVVFAVFVCALVGLFGGSQISFHFILPGGDAPDPDADVEGAEDGAGRAEAEHFVFQSPEFYARVCDTAHELAARRAPPTGAHYRAAREIELVRDPAGACDVCGSDEAADPGFCDSPEFFARVRATARRLAGCMAQPEDLDFVAAREIELLRDPSGSCESKLAAPTDVEETSDTPASASPEGESA